MTLEALTSLAFTLIGVLLAIDILGDLGQGAAFSHVATEVGAFAIAMFILGRFFVEQARRWFYRAERLDAERVALERERDEWRERSRGAVQGLATVIDQQFDAWRLSPAEREIALLILKGLSHKEIAEVRKCSEKTVRQQAASLYGKAGLSGKGHLAAFFLEDLILPPPPAKTFVDERFPPP